MVATESPIVLDGLLERAKALRQGDDWESFRPGVEARWLYRVGDGGAAAVLLRYQPGARVALHEHVGYEHLLVLEGDQYDEFGTYPSGTLAINVPGTRHSPGSKGGCVALLIYEKAVRFVESSD
ncbi:MAG: cupin domain-containing protein [Pseudomonadota bacterium]